jgi:ATP-dependent protease Clp ATPase subunit
MSKYQPPTIDDIPTVQEIVRRMNKTVVGLKKVKHRLALMLRRHLVAAVNGSDDRPPNILIIGGSGSGKTFMLRALLNAVPAIWTEVNATEYSDVGYAGRDLVSMYTGFAEPQWRGAKAEKGAPEAERSYKVPEIAALAERFGVVVIDEFDKWRMPAVMTHDRNTGRALQAELLKMVEGSETFVKKDEEDRHGFTFHTHNVLNIAVGAFQELDRVIAKDMNTDYTRPDLFEHVSLQNLIDYGFMEELVGRFSTVIALPPPDTGNLMGILRDQLVPRYIHQANNDGIELVIEESAISTMAGAVLNFRVGARALAPLLEECLWRSWSEAMPGDRLYLDGMAVQSRHARLIHEVAA